MCLVVYKSIRLEIYSIDEAFLSFAGFDARLESHARELRGTVQQWTGIPVSVGIAPTKTLAKFANRTAKKTPSTGGVCLLLSPEAQTEALARLELTDLWGVAKRLDERLRAIGITTPLELRDADPRLIPERFSGRSGCDCRKCRHYVRDRARAGCPLRRTQARRQGP